MQLYRKELSAQRAETVALRKQIGRRKSTFLYASKTEAHNHAQLLAAYLHELQQAEFCSTPTWVRLRRRQRE